MANSTHRKSTKGVLITGMFTLAAAIITWHPWTTPSETVSPKVVKIIAGTVVEEGSNMSIPQAQITLVGRNDHYFTESNGNFRIEITGENVSHIRVRVTKMNYEPFDMSFEIPNENIIIPLEKIK